MTIPQEGGGGELFSFIYCYAVSELHRACSLTEVRPR